MVSVVIPVYNRAKQISRAVHSVLAQSYQNFEIILVDDGSTDETADVLKNLKQSHEQIKLISLPGNRGVSFARNKGIEQAQGRFIAFLDSDDEWLPIKLETQLKTLKDTGCQWVHTNEDWVRNGKPLKQKSHHRKAGGWQFTRSLELCVISPSSVMINADVIRQNLFDESYEVCEDYDLWLRLSLVYPIAYVESSQITKHGGHEDQLSMKYRGMDKWRIQSMRKYWNAKMPWYWKQCLYSESRKKLQYFQAGSEKHGNSDGLEWSSTLLNELFGYEQAFKSISDIHPR
jgi:glycosyltransferase involved in cell wall biosynthesis